MQAQFTMGTANILGTLGGGWLSNGLRVGTVAAESITLADLQTRYSSKSITEFAKALKENKVILLNQEGLVTPVNRQVLVNALEESGAIKYSTWSRGKKFSTGTGYIFEDGTVVRLMEPAGQLPHRATWGEFVKNSKIEFKLDFNYLNPLTGRPPPTLKGVSKAERDAYIVPRTHWFFDP
jgi:hypothetical protein